MRAAASLLTYGSWVFTLPSITSDIFLFLSCLSQIRGYVASDNGSTCEV